MRTTPTSAGVATSFRPALTPEDFRAWLELRRSAGHSLSAIGRSLGVGHRAITFWINGTSGVSDTVLLLAELLRRAPVDLSAGLPGDGRRVGS